MLKRRYEYDRRTSKMNDMEDVHEQFELQEFDNDPFLYVTIYYDLFEKIDSTIFIKKLWD